MNMFSCPDGENIMLVVGCISVSRDITWYKTSLWLTFG